MHGGGIQHHACMQPDVLTATRSLHTTVPNNAFMLHNHTVTPSTHMHTSRWWENPGVMPCSTTRQRHTSYTPCGIATASQPSKTAGWARMLASAVDTSTPTTSTPSHALEYGAVLEVHEFEIFCVSHLCRLSSMAFITILRNVELRNP